MYKSGLQKGSTKMTGYDEVECEAEAEQTDADVILYMLRQLYETANTVQVETTNKLKCVSPEGPVCMEVKGCAPAQYLTPLFEEMAGLLRRIDTELQEARRAVGKAQLPEW